MTTSPVMALLGQGVPLSLLIDLASPAGPDSRGILGAERRGLGVDRALVDLDLLAVRTRRQLLAAAAPA